MKNLRTRDKVAAVIAVLTLVSLPGEVNNGVDLLIGVAINVGIVYGVAAILGFFRKRSKP